MKPLTLAALGGVAVMTLGVLASAGLAQPPAAATGGQALFSTKCAGCHDMGLERAPETAALRRMTAANILTALNGVMAPQAYGLSDADKQAIALLLIPYDIQFTYALPPGVSADIIEAYRKAFDQAVLDPEYRAVATKLNQIIAPRSGKQVEDAIKKMASTSAAVRQRVIELISKD